MLILTRRVGESLMVIEPTGEIKKVTVLGVRGNQVRIGVDAPLTTKVHREEIWNRIQAEKNTEEEEEKNSSTPLRAVANG